VGDLLVTGSTGKPKGVCLPHQALVNLIMWEVHQTSFKPLTTLQFAPISFDVHFQVCRSHRGGRLRRAV
jgi:non-ribosomal peptide synthetase component F